MNAHELKRHALLFSVLLNSTELDHALCPICNKMVNIICPIWGRNSPEKRLFTSYGCCSGCITKTPLYNLDDEDLNITISTAVLIKRMRE